MSRPEESPGSFGNPKTNCKDLHLTLTRLVLDRFLHGETYYIREIVGFGLSLASGGYLGLAKIQATLKLCVTLAMQA